MYKVQHYTKEYKTKGSVFITSEVESINLEYELINNYKGEDGLTHVFFCTLKMKNNNEYIIGISSSKQLDKAEAESLKMLARKEDDISFWMS